MRAEEESQGWTWNQRLRNGKSRCEGWCCQPAYFWLCWRLGSRVWQATAGDLQRPRKQEAMSQQERHAPEWEPLRKPPHVHHGKTSYEAVLETSRLLIHSCIGLAKWVPNITFDHLTSHNLCRISLSRIFFQQANNKKRDINLEEGIMLGWEKLGAKSREYVNI